MFSFRLNKSFKDREETLGLINRYLALLDYTSLHFHTAYQLENEKKLTRLMLIRLIEVMKPVPMKFLEPYEKTLKELVILMDDIEEMQRPKKEINDIRITFVKYRD